MVKGGYGPGRTHPTDRTRGQTAAMSATVAAAGQPHPDDPLVRMETAASGPSHAVSLPETPSETFTPSATVILRRYDDWTRSARACRSDNDSRQDLRRRPPAAWRQPVGKGKAEFYVGAGECSALAGRQHPETDHSVPLGRLVDSRQLVRGQRSTSRWRHGAFRGGSGGVAAPGSLAPPVATTS